MQQQTFQEENLPTAISQLRADRQVPALGQHFDGGQCRVFKVDFAHGESWAVRVPILFQNASQEPVIDLVQCEVNIIEELERRGFRWAAKLRGHSLTFDNAVGCPFIALTWIPGTQLSWSHNFPARPLRDKVLHQVAMIHASLLECTKETTRTTATEHFTRIINHKIDRVRNGLLPEITEKDCLDQKNILPSVLLPELDDAPFTMDHGDLAAQNIIIDAEHNVTGIIDWGFCQKMPFQLGARFPRFLHLQHLPPSSVLQKDRETYIASLQSQPSQSVSWMTLVLSSNDVDFQMCFLESIISKGMHRQLARNGWKLPYCEQASKERGNE